MIVNFTFVQRRPFGNAKDGDWDGKKDDVHCPQPSKLTDAILTCLPFLPSAGALKFSQHAGEIISFILNWLYHLLYSVVLFSHEWTMPCLVQGRFFLTKTLIVLYTKESPIDKVDVQPISDPFRKEDSVL